jgi:hypothetical protein
MGAWEGTIRDKPAEVGEVGRPETPIEPASEAIGEFAAALREIRIKAGEPTYQKLAKSCHYSKTTLARAASGRNLPSLDVTLAFVQACGGDVKEWQARWEEVRQRSVVVPAVEADFEQGAEFGRDASQVAEPPPLSRWRWRQRAGRVGLLISVAANIVLLAVVLMQPGSSPKAGPVRLEDGMDPKSTQCAVDATTLDQRPIVLVHLAKVGERTLAAGTKLGTVTLRYSPHCLAAWARFDPALSTFSSPDTAVVLIDAARPAEGTQTTFRLPHVDQTYTDLLLTGVGCVTAHVAITLAGQTLGEQTTACLPRM